MLSQFTSFLFLLLTKCYLSKLRKKWNKIHGRNWNILRFSDFNNISQINIHNFDKGWVQVIPGVTLSNITPLNNLLLN